MRVLRVSKDMQKRNRINSMQSRSWRESGFTLWEVLAAMVIMAISVLGIASLQLMSLQANRGAFYSTQAVQIASEILDAMRANASQAAFYANGASTREFKADTGALTDVPADPSCATDPAGCTQEGMASIDIRQWASHFVDVFSATDFRPTLPGGIGHIEANGDVYIVTVSWRQQVFEDDGDGNAARNVATDSITLSSAITP